jgi:hypothetical protein
MAETRTVLRFRVYISITIDSEDDDCDFLNINSILVVDRVASPIRWSPVFVDIADCEAVLIS